MLKMVNVIFFSFSHPTFCGTPFVLQLSQYVHFSVQVLSIENVRVSQWFLGAFDRLIWLQYFSFKPHLNGNLLSC